MLLKWSPLITFDNFHNPSPLPCLHFPSKFEWSPLWILPKFSATPPFGFSVTTDPPFFLPKIEWSPLKSSPPPAQVITNDRFLTFAIGGRCNRYFWDIRLEILMLHNFNMLFPLVLKTFSKVNCFRVYRKLVTWSSYLINHKKHQCCQYCYNSNPKRSRRSLLLSRFDIGHTWY